MLDDVTSNFCVFFPCMSFVRRFMSEHLCCGLLLSFCCLCCLCLICVSLIGGACIRGAYWRKQGVIGHAGVGCGGGDSQRGVTLHVTCTKLAVY